MANEKTVISGGANSDATRSNKIISVQGEGEHGVTGVLVEQLPPCLGSNTQDPGLQSDCCMKRTIILRVINTLYNDMIVPSIIIPDSAPDLELV